MYWVDKTSLVGENAFIGDGTKIWQFCNIMNNSVIGADCNIGQGVFIENGVRLGNNVKIKNNVALYNGVTCEDNVFLGPNCVFTNVINPRSFIEKKSEFKQTYIEQGATIGANVTVVCGHRIGKYALIGAGSVVTKDVAPYALMVGNPARQRGYVCRCGEKLEQKEKKFQCIKCHRKYQLKNSIMEICGENENGIY